MPFYYSRTVFDLRITGANQGTEAELNNLLRGAILLRFRHQVCDDIQRECLQCTLKSVCLYSGLFENLQNNPRKIMPYILTLKSLEKPYDYQLEVILLAFFAPAHPYFLHILEGMQKNGFSKEKLELQILDSFSETRIFQWPDIHEVPVPESLELEFTTPLCLYKNKKALDHFDLGAFLGTLSRRAMDLHCQYQQGNSSEAQDGLPWMNIPELLKNLNVEQHLTLLTWERISQKNLHEIQRKGLVGTLRFSGPGVPELWPWLILMEDFHLGKGSSFGLGQYRGLWRKNSM